jgi:hypothetical protein
MTNNILIAGAGTMGTHYTRNLIGLADALKLKTLMVVDRDAEKCSKLKQAFPIVDVRHVDAASHEMAHVIAGTDITGIIGATQTDTHLTVLKEALSVGKDRPQITSVLQEKPFGLFDDDVNAFDDVAAIIRQNDIRFNLDSILMFSAVYDVFGSFLKANPDLMHVGTYCTYGKNRTRDTRPAHMGVFGTEGTHALDIARRVGHAYLPLTFDHGKIAQGFVTEQDNDIPYETNCVLRTDKGMPVRIEMSLAFDANYRRVRHIFNNAKGEVVSVILEFDQQQGDRKLDSIQIRNETTKKEWQYDSMPSSTKMQSALVSTFGDKSGFSYDIDQARDLRTVLKDIMQRSAVRRTTGTPVLSKPHLP